MSKGKKSRRNKKKPPILTPAQAAARQAAITAGVLAVLNREEILVRLLNTAIRMWFEGDESLSVHIIASAAYKTLSDLLSDRGGTPWLTKVVGYESLTETYDQLRHASTDAAEKIEFIPIRNLMLLAAAVT